MTSVANTVGWFVHLRAFCFCLPYPDSVAAAVESVFINISYFIQRLMLLYGLSDRVVVDRAVFVCVARTHVKAEITFSFCLVIKFRVLK